MMPRATCRIPTRKATRDAIIQPEQVRMSHQPRVALLPVFPIKRRASETLALCRESSAAHRTAAVLSVIRVADDRQQT